MAEDFLFNIDYFMYMDSVVLVDKYNYYYFQDNNSSLTKTKDVDFLWKMAELRLSYCEEKYKEMGIYGECEKNIDTAFAVELIAPTYDILKEIYYKFIFNT